MCKVAKICCIATLVFLLSTHIATSQESRYKQFRKLSCPEKQWVLFHPFSAKKAFRITVEARSVVKTIMDNQQLDGDNNGGQIDAFRHAYWMARLSQEMHWRKVYKLGKAHEKGNKKYFKKHKTEDGTIPDAISCEMDLLNNDIGIEIGKNNKEINKEKLKQLIEKKVYTGEFWVIKKDKNSNFLDKEGNILNPDDYIGKWENKKCLVKSNYKRR